ncbi:hypothetical protein M5585_09230 [Serratia ureilytica]
MSEQEKDFLNRRWRTWCRWRAGGRRCTSSRRRRWTKRAARSAAAAAGNFLSTDFLEVIP